MAGAVTDDGLPVGAAVTSAWSKASGPGIVTFANAATPQTSASFSVAGTYVLQLSASDTALSSSATVTITVIARNQPPRVSAGAAQTIRLPAAAALSGTATDDGLPANSQLSVAWSQVGGPGAATFSAPNAVATQASFPTAGAYVLRLTASDTQLAATSDVAVTVLPANQAPVVGAGPAQTVILPAAINLAGTVSDDGLPAGATVTSAWSKVSGPGAAAFANAAAPRTGVGVNQAGTYVFQLSASDTALSSSATVTVTVQLSNQPPRVDAGPAQTVTLPAAAALTGAVTDDGLPVGAVVRDTWAKVSGPGNVTFANPAAPRTTAAFDRAGVYALSLTGDDTQFARVARTTVTVEAANQPPRVSAGPALTVEIGSLATLNGTATDDGLPRGGGLAVGWTRVGGPGATTFAAPFAAQTNATFSAVGIYTLRLTAGDSLLTSTSDVRVVVTAKANRAPVVHAGPAQTLQGIHTATLAGSVTDDGLPAGSTLTSAWSRVGGPGTVVFSDPTNPAATATFGAPGAYVLKLAATDGALAASDLLNVTVNDPNRAPEARAGAAQTVTLPANALLTGTATDDGLPAPPTLTFAWSEVSGPAPATVANPGSARTAVSFTAPGDYLFGLNVGDGQLAGADRTTVHVLAPCNHPAPAGLVGFWTGDDTTNDAFGDSPALLLGGTTYGPGEVGDAFYLSGTVGSGVRIHGTNSTDAGRGGAGLSVECWINPVNPAPSQALLIWSNPNTFRSHFYIYGAPGALYCNLLDAANGYHTLSSPAGTVTGAGWQHVALTYDKASGIGRLYCDGAIVAEQNLGAFDPQTDGDLFFGNYNGGALFQGGMDEVSLYQRALTPAEIQAVFLAGADGKCRRPLNRRPVVGAGPNLTFPVSFQPALQGAVTDDGLPAGGLLASTWTQVSGPGPVAFTDASSPISTVGFPLAGTYVLQLAASDGALGASSRVTFTVVPDDQPVSPTVVISPYRAVWRYAIYPYGQVPADVGSLTFDDTGYQSAPGSFGSGGGCPVQANTQTPWPGSTEIVLRRWIDLPASVTNVRVSGTVDNDIDVIINGVDMSGGFIGHENCAQLDDTRINIVATSVLKPGPNLFVLRGRDRGGESFLDAQFLVDQPIGANAGNNFSVPGGAPAALDGSASAALSGKPLSYQWTQSAGPAVPLDLGDPARPRFNAPRLAANTDCVFKLIVTDGQVVSAPASVTVTVLASALGGTPANRAPVVTAGPDQTLSAGFTASLQGAASDDGLPAGSILRTMWSVVSGPGAVAFADPSAPATRASFARTGTYVLQLLAGDGELTAASRVAIVVGSTGNLPFAGDQPPGVSAGPGATAPLSAASAVPLAGSVTDDGLPLGGGLTSLWSQVSGPAGGVAFANPRSPATTAAFVAAGRYVLRLTANDGALQSASDMTVIITSGGTGGAGQPGGIFVTGHDSDWHAAAGLNNKTGAIHIVRAAVGYVTFGKPNPKLLLVSDPRLIALGTGLGDPRVGLANAGYAGFDVADHDGIGAANDGPLADLRAVDFGAYDAVVVASDGWMAQPELDILIARAGDLAAFVNGGGGVVAFSEAGPGTVGLTQHDQYRFLPFVTAIVGVDQTEASNRITALGASIGLADADTIGNYSHNLFQPSPTLGVVDYDGAGRVLSLAGRGQNVTALGVENQPPRVDAGPAQSVTLPAGAQLAGSVVDDGLPAGGVLAAAWSQVSGPGTVVFSLASSPRSLASFPLPGVYTLRLGATDGALASAADVRVTVVAAPPVGGGGGTPPVNQAPTIDLGPAARTVPFGQSLTIDPLLADDGLPGGTLDFSWAQLDGPGNAAFADASATPGLGYYAATLSFPAAGLYHLRAGASDGALSASADLAVTVTPGATRPPAVGVGSPADGASFPRGQPIPLTASAGDPDGFVASVAFLVDGVPVGAGAPDQPADGGFSYVWTGAPAGVHVVTSVAVDNSGTPATSAPVTITVTPALPSVALTYPPAHAAFQAGDRVALQAGASPGGDGAAIASVRFLVNGQAVGSTALAPYGAIWTVPAAGDYTLAASATDSAGRQAASAGVPVRAVDADSDPAAPTTVDLASPTEGQEVTAPVVVTGTVDGPTLQSWTLDYRRRSSPCAEWTTFAAGTGVVDASPLGTFDPTLVPNGLYDLRLSATSAGGRTDLSSASVVVDGGMKVGRFTVAFNDLSVPLAGLPITVTRAYDSAEKCPGDFGVGWNLDVSTVKLEKNYALGDAWYADYEPQDPIYIPTYFLEDAGPHVITVTFPDGKAYKFQPILTLADGSPASRYAAPISSSEPLKMAFKALPGTQGTLAASGIPKSLYLSDDAYLAGIDFLDAPFDGSPFADATGWTFTAQDGRAFTFDARGKLLMMADRNGNTLSFTPAGIFHSSGRSVLFTRDARGRITAVTDPLGQSLLYAYDAAGNLAGVTDRRATPAPTPTMWRTTSRVWWTRAASRPCATTTTPTDGWRVPWTPLATRSPTRTTWAAGWRRSPTGSGTPPPTATTNAATCSYRLMQLVRSPASPTTRTTTNSRKPIRLGVPSFTPTTLWVE